MKSNNLSEKDNITRCKIIIKGTVQGVGFRPLVYQLAQKYKIKGSVLNSSEGVVIDAEGSNQDVEMFLNDIKENPPSLSVISNIHKTELNPKGYTSFEILISSSDAETDALIPPDVATCKECKRDILNPKDNHYRYPFTNCTNCGPRFTIIKKIPYDRPMTSMASFKMCDDCSKEYNDPLNRRFHAQPVACPKCGPQVWITDNIGKKIGEDKNWLENTWNILKQGENIALKSIGGFHLACDARNQEAVKQLRIKKSRKAKPFAIMCRDIETIEKFCSVSIDESNELKSKQAPIVILRKKTDCDLPEQLAPGLKSLGIMLPYSPLHMLIFSGPFDVLVMTSGNYSELPLAIDNNDALLRLGSIADYFLLNDREIINRCDDSLVQIMDAETLFFRRSRGYVPNSIKVNRGIDSPVILGIGGEMKNTFCIMKKDQAFMSQYIGEIDTLEGEENLLNSLLHFQALIDVEPEIVAYDAHPDYASSKIADKIYAKKYEKVYHHHAHLASCMAENGFPNETCIGVILDGTGYGTDGSLWGFEIFTGNYIDFKREFHLANVPLPGGETAIKQPWRTAVSYLITFLGDEGKKYAETIFKDKDVLTIEKIVKTGFNSPLACGCGRLFDAVSAILGVCLENTYEGQAAIELGEPVLENDKSFTTDSYEYEIKKDIIDPEKILRGVVSDKLSGLAAAEIAAKFHNTLADIICDVVKRISSDTGIKKVILSGGTWHNSYLFKKVKNKLRNSGYEVFYHKKVPTNDGCIALGQAMVAHWRWTKPSTTKKRD